MKKLAPGPRNRNLNLLGQGLRRIFGLRNLEVRFGSWNIGSFCGKGTEEYEELKKEKWMHVVLKKKDGEN